MVDLCTKMKLDAFRLQLQAVLTTYYEDIMGVQGDIGCPKPKIVKRRFEDQDDAGTTQGRTQTPRALPPPHLPPQLPH